MMDMQSPLTISDGTNDGIFYKGIISSLLRPENDASDVESYSYIYKER